MRTKQVGIFKMTARVLRDMKSPVSCLFDPWEQIRLLPLSLNILLMAVLHF